MTDSDCAAFLQWALPRLQMRWPGFRKVRHTVCKRIDARLKALGLADVAAYRLHLGAAADEWRILDGLCSIPISRFYRDRAVFDFLAENVLPELARRAAGHQEHELHVWSCGCAAGEEPYTLTIIWKLRVQATSAPPVRLRIVATDTDGTALARARTASYGWSSVKDLPTDWRERAFARRGDEYCLRPEFGRDVEFLNQDVRTALPETAFHLILCRNLVFTYFDEPLQRRTLERILTRLVLDGALVIGKGESLPAGATPCEPWSAKLGIYRQATRAV
jgi:chemotaxis protein methyltransferase CheR